MQTGLKSYRLSVFDELPRTGLPYHFESWSEYERSIELLVSAGLIEDATKLWWDLRPSARFPTLEMRITDVCPLVEDGIALQRRGRDEAVTLVTGLGRLHTAGGAVDWSAFFRGSNARKVDLPTYAFQRERYWLDTVDYLAESWIADEIGNGGAGTLKKILTEALNELFAPVRARRAGFASDLGHLRAVLEEGNARANAVADATLDDVRTAMGMRY